MWLYVHVRVPDYVCVCVGVCLHVGGCESGIKEVMGLVSGCGGTVVLCDIKSSGAFSRENLF